MSNPHLKNAETLQAWVNEWQSREGDTDATQLANAFMAQAEATLALAYEQHVANLMTFREIQYAAEQRGWPIGQTMDKGVHAIDLQILSSLGLQSQQPGTKGTV